MGWADFLADNLRGCSARGFGVKCHKESGCQTVAEGDYEALATGRIAPWILNARAKDISDAVGLPQNEVFELFGTRGLAEVHVNQFVPLCRSMEGDLWTTDQGQAEARILAPARAAFVAAIREGRINVGNTPNNYPPGGELPPGTPVPIPPGGYGGTIVTQPYTRQPTQAGGSSLALVGLIAAAAFLKG